jgi:hypothetical protein
MCMLFFFFSFFLFIFKPLGFAYGSFLREHTGAYTHGSGVYNYPRSPNIGPAPNIGQRQFCRDTFFSKRYIFFRMAHRCFKLVAYDSGRMEVFYDHMSHYDQLELRNEKKMLKSAERYEFYIGPLLGVPNIGPPWPRPISRCSVQSARALCALYLWRCAVESSRIQLVISPQTLVISSCPFNVFPRHSYSYHDPKNY